MREGKFQGLVQSFQEILREVTALEVRTVIVEEILPDSFSPWQVYQEIYAISPNGLTENPYLELRRQLELEYSLLLQDPLSELYEPGLVQGQLPAPQETRVQILLKNRRFLAKLRKLSLIKDILDQNSVYAETVIELDGTITNKYTQRLLEHPQREQILAIHTQGVTEGGKQWGGIIGFIVKLIKSFPRS